MLRFLFGLLALVAVAVAAYFAGRTDPGAQRERAQLQKRVGQLEEETARLRGLIKEGGSAHPAAAAEAEIARTIEAAVENIRGIKFTRPVNYTVVTRAEITAMVGEKLAQFYTPEDFEKAAAAWSRLGLLPAGYPLREKYIELLGEQIAAFYDQHAGKLYMFSDAKLENTQNRIVLAHELTHALADQHFTLKKMPLELKTNDDLVAASSALIEGEATAVMSEYMLSNLSLAAMKDNFAAALTQNMEKLAAAPRYLRESLTFPYLRGQEFCLALIASGGYAAIDRAYSEPPLSTAQILHPEKYLATPREDPLPIQWEGAFAALPGERFHNVLGEFGIRIFLGEWLPNAPAEEIAAGWRGDQYIHFRPDGALVWRSLWATEKDATEFTSALEQIATSGTGGRVRSVERAGLQVTWVDAATREEADKLRAALQPE